MLFNWFFFLLLTAGITVVRALFVTLSTRPLRLFSIDTAVWLGFILFFALPAGFVPNLIGISHLDYTVHILLGYCAFCVASLFVDIVGRPLSKIGILSLRVTPALLRIAYLYCLIFIAIHFGLFFSTGGFGAVRDLWLLGDPMRAYLREVETMMMVQTPTRNVLTVMLRTLEIFFFAFWGLMFKRKPFFSTAIWYVYVLTLLNEYMGRTTLAVFLIIPWACYVLTFHPSGKSVFLQSVGLLCAATVSLAVLSYLRLGYIERISGLGLYDVIEELKASTFSAVPGTWVLNLSYRGDWAEYLVGLFSYPVPRIIWGNKPLIEFNLLMTSIMTGRSVGPDNSIMTFTMLAEGWFYFGALGSTIIMFLFGFSAKIFEKLFSSNDLFLASYGFLVLNALLQIRSTFLGFYSFALTHFITVFVLLLLVKARFPKKISGTEK